MLPIYLTPYISAHVDEPKTLARPFEIPTNPKNKNAYKGESKKYNKINPINKGILIIGINFLLVNLSTKKPEKNNVNTELIE